MRGTCDILVKRNGALEECAKPSVYSEPCCCGCDVDAESHPTVHHCAEHFDELVILPERCWHCGSDDHGSAACPISANLTNRF
jgi:hypothetical protein